ncbi:MAG: 3-dehydroquinate synthase [Magnetococcus sp. WYHC-3]
MTTAPQPPHRLSLDLGDRSYDILIGSGLLPRLDQWVLPLVAGRQLAIVTNDVVAPLYLDGVRQALERAGLEVSAVILPDGEEHKDWPTLQRIFDHLITQRHERGTTLLALGGGVVGDMTGFAAACFLRGVRFIQVPTTLLAQVDASVGGKTGINHPLGKNLVGAFYQPRLVAIDTDTLATLPRREYLAGLAEVIKYGVIWDGALFAELEAHSAAIVRQDAELVGRIIHRCCAIKAEVVGADERESGQRALLNMGHTFGHAIETVTRYETYLHGEAVAIGLVQAAELSRRLGLCAGDDARRVRALVAACGLPVSGPPGLDGDACLEAMTRDKKVEAGQVRFVVMEGLGRARLHGGVDPALVREIMTGA